MIVLKKQNESAEQYAARAMSSPPPPGYPEVSTEWQDMVRAAQAEEAREEQGRGDS